MIATLESHKSRHGYHPCDYQTYLKLKELNKYYWITKNAYGKWRRWHNKQPQNRIRYQLIKDDLGRIIGRKVLGPIIEPKVCPHFRIGPTTNKWHIYEPNLELLYEDARTPNPEPATLFNQEQLDKIDGWFGRVSEWFSGNR